MASELLSLSVVEGATVGPTNRGPGGRDDDGFAHCVLPSGSASHIVSLPRRASQPRNRATHRVWRVAGGRGHIGGTAASACTLGDRGRFARDRCPCGGQFRGPSASRTHPHPGALRGGSG